MLLLCFSRNETLVICEADIKKLAESWKTRGGSKPAAKLFIFFSPCTPWSKRDITSHLNLAFHCRRRSPLRRVFTGRVIWLHLHSKFHLAGSQDHKLTCHSPRGRNFWPCPLSQFLATLFKKRVSPVNSYLTYDSPST